MNVYRTARAAAYAMGMATLATPGHAAVLNAQTLMSGFNNIVLGDISNNSETQGTVFIGGDYNRTGGGSDKGVNPDRLAAVDVGGGISGTFIVGGSVYKRPHLASGDAKIGGTINGSIINNGGGSIQTGVSGIPVEQVGQVLKKASLDLSKLGSTSNGTAYLSDRNQLRLDVSGTSSALAVFNISGSVLASGTFQGINVDPSITVVVNVSGTNINVGANFNQVNTNVVFNFFEAATLNFNSTFNYSVLAPLANVKVGGGGIKGTVVSGNLVQNSEIRPGTFTGTLPLTDTSNSVDPPSAVPLPASFVLLGGALAGLGMLRRSRRAAA